MSFIFGTIFLLLRVYEFLLIRARIDGHPRLATLELGSIGYDFVIAIAIVAMMLMANTAIAVFRPRTAYLISTAAFAIILVLNFVAIHYFVSTLTPLSWSALSGYLGKMLTGIAHSYANWTSITPIIVLLPLAIAAFGYLRESMLVQQLSRSSVVGMVLLINVSWFMPMTPSSGAFADDQSYHIASNKTYLLFCEFVDKVIAAPSAEMSEATP